MKIGVLSDTHDNLDNLLTVLETFRDRDIETVIHCGDLTDFSMISHFSGFRLIYLIGNMDQATGTIKKRVENLREDNFAGLVFQGKLDGIMVAATHSHIEGKVMALVQEKRFDWIFHGHTHQWRDETIRGTPDCQSRRIGWFGSRSSQLLHCGPHRRHCGNDQISLKKGRMTMDYDTLCAYLDHKPGARRDMPFGPDSLVYKVLLKMFALVAWQADPLKISLKADPIDAVILRKQYPAVKPGYYMSKKHWNTITLDGSIPDEELLRMIDDSYDLVAKGMTRADKAVLKEMGWEENA